MGGESHIKRVRGRKDGIRGDGKKNRQEEKSRKVTELKTEVSTCFGHEF